MGGVAIGGRHGRALWIRVAAAALFAVGLCAVGPGRTTADEPVVPVVTLTADVAYAYPGDDVTLTAAVTPNPGGGTVTFVHEDVATTDLGAVPVSPTDGTAVLHTSAVAPGITSGFRVRAAFSGFGGYAQAYAILTIEIRYLPNVAFPAPPGNANATSASVPFIVGLGVTTECRLDGAPWADCISPWTGDGLAEGTHVLEVRGTTSDGRTGNPYPVSWAVDLTPPVPGELSLDGGVATTNHTFLNLVATASDNLSGVVEVRTSWDRAMDADGNLAAPASPYEPDRPWQIGVNMTVESGPQTLWAQWFDAAGNASPIRSTTIDVRIAWPRLAAGAWATTQVTVPFEIEGVDPSEIRAVEVQNLPPSWSQLPAPVRFATAPATWSIVEPGDPYLSGPGFRGVSVRWQDAQGNWSDPRIGAINLLPAPRDDLVLDEGATLTRDAIVQADLSIGSVLYRGYDLGIALSCDGDTWAVYRAPIGLVPIRVDDPDAACPATPGPRTIHMRWRWDESAWSEPRTANIDFEPDPMLPQDDASPPEGTIAIDGGAAAVDTTAVSLSVPAVDGASGVTMVRLSNDGSTWVTRPYAATQAWALPAGNGRRIVWVAWRDGAANWSEPTSGSVILDTVAPRVTVPTVRLVTGSRITSSGSMSALVRWAGSDTGSGIAHYQVAVSVSGGGFRTVASSVRSTSFSRSLATGHTYRFRIRAIDAAGNVGAWAASVTVSPGLVSDRSARYAGAWRTVRARSRLGGTERVASSPGASATFKVRARAVAWIATVGPGRGVAKVVVDGKVVATIHLGASATTSRRVVWTAVWHSAGFHAVQIRVVSPSHGPVGVDALAILR
jgi:Fibronectin type III domain